MERTADFLVFKISMSRFLGPGMGWHPHLSSNTLAEVQAHPPLPPPPFPPDSLPRKQSLTSPKKGRLKSLNQTSFISQWLDFSSNILWNPVGPVDTWIVEKRILESWQLAVKSLNPISIFCLDLPTVQGSACILKIFLVFSPSDALKSGESLNLRPQKRVAPKMWSKHIKN